MKDQPNQLNVKPMPAGKFDPVKAVFPCYVQPKIDGIRCLFDGKTAWSRNGNLFIGEIQALLSRIDLTSLPPDTILDGELYIHGKSFQQIASAVKRAQPLTGQLQYYVFDAIFLSNISFSSRWKLLRILSCDFRTEFHLVATFPCGDQAALEQYHDTFVAAGFEGLIYRRSDSEYCQGRLSSAILKYKAFMDAEYTILGCVEGQGPAAGTPVFICGVSEDLRFRVNMEGPYELRRLMWLDRELLIGKPLTVRFQELTDRGVPRFPVGVAIRDYEGAPGPGAARDAEKPNFGDEVRQC